MIKVTYLLEKLEVEWELSFCMLSKTLCHWHFRREKGIYVYWAEGLKGKIEKDARNKSVVSRDEVLIRGAGRCSFLPRLQSRMDTSFCTVRGGGNTETNVYSTNSDLLLLPDFVLGVKRSKDDLENVLLILVNSAKGDGSRHRLSRCCIISLVIKKYIEQEGSVDKVPNRAWHAGTFSGSRA